MDFRTRYQYNPKTDLIGKGGFAKVYKGYDTIRECTVALKFFKSDISEKYDLVSEIKRVINFEHPNICRYYDIAILQGTNHMGEEERTEVGILEYIDGGDIRTYLRQHPQHRNKLLKDVLHGLSYLHSNAIKKVIHRDIKPNNILIKNTTEGPIAKITDFGISKAVNSTSNPESSLLLGTIEFMAPEQFSLKNYGINGKLSTNVDLWSWGCLAYEIIMGESLFGSREKGDDTLQIQNNILQEDYNQKLRAIPEPYQQAVRVCLVKEASKRVQNAEGIIAVLEGAKKPATDEETKKIEIKPATHPSKKDKAITPLNVGNTDNDQGGKPKIAVYIKLGVIVLLIIGIILFAPIKKWLCIGDNGFTKTTGGLEYKIFGGEGNTFIKIGNTVKLQAVQYYEDSLIRIDTLPRKLYFDSQTPISFLEIFLKARKGDSVVIRTPVDSFINFDPIKPYSEKGKYVVSRYKIWDIVSDSAGAAQQTKNSGSITETTHSNEQVVEKKQAYVEDKKPNDDNKVHLRIKIKPGEGNNNLDLPSASTAEKTAIQKKITIAYKDLEKTRDDLNGLESDINRAKATNAEKQKTVDLVGQMYWLLREAKVLLDESLKKVTLVRLREIENELYALNKKANSIHDECFMIAYKYYKSNN